MINEVARAMTKGEHTNERTYVLTYIRTGQTLYPLHNFVVRGDNDAKTWKFTHNSALIIIITAFIIPIVLSLSTFRLTLS